MVRKSVLTGWVLLIPPKYGILRVTFALLLCLGTLVIILADRPYRVLQRNLAESLSSLSLFVTFLAVLFFKIHTGIEDADLDTSKVFGFSTVLPFTITLLVFNFLVLAWVVTFVGLELLRLRSLPRIRLRSTHEMPQLKLPPGQRFHCFMSQHSARVELALFQSAPPRRPHADRKIDSSPLWQFMGNRTRS